MYVKQANQQQICVYMCVCVYKWLSKETYINGLMLKLKFKETENLQYKRVITHTHTQKNWQEMKPCKLQKTY